MALKTRQEYEQQILGDIISNQTATPKVTLFKIGGALRALVISVSGVLADITNDILQFKRGRVLDTCAILLDGTSADLDAYGSERGIARNGASASSAIVVFSGPDGTVIPAGTVLQTSGVAQTVNFTTLTAITLGSANPGIPGLTSVGFGNAVLCASAITGAQANVPPNTITVISPAITGVTCTNPLPARGGVDQESSVNYRERMRNHVNILAQGTEAFYEAAAQAFDPTVLRAFAEYDATTNGTKVVLLKNDGSAFDGTTLTNAATSIATKQRAAEPIACVNVTMVGLAIVVGGIQFKVGVDVATGYANIANALCDFIDWRTWAFGGMVRYFDIANIVSNAPGVAYINLSKLTVNGTLADISIPADSLPRLTGLSITTIDTSETVNYSLTQTWEGISA